MFIDMIPAKSSTQPRWYLEFILGLKFINEAMF